MMEQRVYKWEILDGKGKTVIRCDENAENAVAHAMVERKVGSGVPFGMGHRRFRLISRLRD